MIINSVQKLSKEIGKDIGRSDNKVQADLLNGFAYGFKSMRMQKHDEDMQICYIVDELSDETKELIKQIYNFVSEDE